jgi:uncharacterized protein related to proFAR isomerase
MNRLAQEMAERNGYISVTQACRKFDTTKGKIRELVSRGLLSLYTSDLDRRTKFIDEADLQKLLGESSPNNESRKKTRNGSESL